MPSTKISLTYDENRGFLWEDKVVETTPVILTDAYEVQQRIDYLTPRCRQLHRLGVDANPWSVQCRWFERMKPNDPLLGLLKQGPRFLQQGMSQRDHHERLRLGRMGVMGGLWTPQDAPTGAIGWLVGDPSQFVRYAPISKVGLTTPGTYVTVRQRGYYDAIMGQPVGEKASAATLDQLRFWLKDHGITDSQIDLRAIHAVSA